MNNRKEDVWQEGLLNRAMPKLLVAIVNRPEGKQTASLMQRMQLRLVLSCMAEGTAGKGLADLMGFGPSGKNVLLGIGPGMRAQDALEELRHFLRLEKPGRGIAFTIPLSGMSLPEKLPLEPEKKAHIQKRVEEGVDNMLEGIRHDLILAVVNQGHSEALMERAQAAGVTGGTVLNARHLSEETAAVFRGVTLQGEREIVAILVARETKQAAMEQIGAFLHEHPKAQGAIIALPVDAVAGLRS